MPSNGHPAASVDALPGDIVMGTSTRALVVFTRSPEAEAAAKGLTGRHGLALVEALLRGWQQAACRSIARFVIATPADSAHRIRHLFPGVPVIIQNGADLGGRIDGAFGAVFGGATRAALLVGGDCAPPAEATLETVFNHLEREGNGLALLPARDGGVNGIGFSRDTPRLLAQVPWYTSRVMAHLVANAAAGGLSVVTTGVDDDLDSRRRLAKILRARPPAWDLYRDLLAATVQAAFVAGPDRQHPDDSVVIPAYALRGPPATGRGYFSITSV